MSDGNVPYSDFGNYTIFFITDKNKIKTSKCILFYVNASQ